MAPFQSLSDGAQRSRLGEWLFRVAVLLLPLGVVGNVALTLMTTEHDVLAAVAGMPVGPLVVAGVLALVPWLTSTLRLRLWTTFVGHPVGLLDGLRVVLGGLLSSAVTPTGSGDVALKWALLARHRIPAGAIGSLLVVETAENALVMIVLLPLVLATTAAQDVAGLRETIVTARGGLIATLVVIALVAAGLVLLARAAARGRLGRTPQRVVARLRSAARSPWADARQVARLVAQRGKRRFALGVGLAAVHWIARYSVVTALLAFLGVPVRPVLFWGLQWATFTAMNVVPTPGAAGGAEAAFALFYSPFVPEGLLGLATAAWRISLFYAPLAVAAVVFLGLGRRTPPVSTASDGAASRRAVNLAARESAPSERGRRRNEPESVVP